MQRTANCQQDLPRLWQILELVKQGHVGLRCEDELGSPGAVALWALSGSCCHVTTIFWKDTEPVYFLFHFFHFLHDMISHIKRSDSMGTHPQASSGTRSGLKHFVAELSKRKAEPWNNGRCHDFSRGPKPQCCWFLSFQLICIYVHHIQ
jgi:hypothetical protein